MHNGFCSTIICIQGQSAPWNSTEKHWILTLTSRVVSSVIFPPPIFLFSSSYVRPVVILTLFPFIYLFVFSICNTVYALIRVKILQSKALSKVADKRSSSFYQERLLCCRIMLSIKFVTEISNFRIPYIVLTVKFPPSVIMMMIASMNSTCIITGTRTD